MAKDQVCPLLASDLTEVEPALPTPAKPQNAPQSSTLKDLFHENGVHDKHDEEFPINSEDGESDDEDLSDEDGEADKRREKEEEELKEAAEVPIEKLVQEWKAMVQKDEAQTKVGMIAVR